MIGTRETGNETYASGLLEGLSRAEADIDLFVYHGSVAPAATSAHMQLKRLITGAPGVRLALDLPGRSVIDRLDVMHTTYTAPLWTACPEVLTVHDISYDSHPEWFSARDLRVLSSAVPWSVRRATRVITVSELCRRQIVERYRLPDAKVVCVYNGPGPAAQPIPRSEAQELVSGLGIDAARPLVLAVGNLQPRKNLVRLIEAFQRLTENGIDAELVIVGPEHYRAELVRRASEGMAARVRLTGYLTDRQLAACYECATVFVFPSLFEGFGIPAVEAMAHGTPVACSNAGALPEVCGDAAEYFDPTDVDAIATAIKRVLTDQTLRDSLSRAGRERQRRFSWQTAALETVAVYRDAVAPSRMRETTT